MKKLLIACLLLFFSGQVVQAEDVMMLKNWKVVKGDIINVTDKGITMKLENGATEFYPKEDIDDQMYQTFLKTQQFEDRYSVDQDPEAEKFYSKILADLEAHRYKQAKQSFLQLQQISPKDYRIARLKQLILDLEKETDPAKEEQLVNAYTQFIIQGIGNMMDHVTDAITE